jgi:hypothetical protein
MSLIYNLYAFACLLYISFPCAVVNADDVSWVSAVHSYLTQEPMHRNRFMPSGDRVDNFGSCHTQGCPSSPNDVCSPHPAIGNGKAPWRFCQATSCPNNQTLYLGQCWCRSSSQCEKGWLCLSEPYTLDGASYAGRPNLFKATGNAPNAVELQTWDDGSVDVKVVFRPGDPPAQNALGKCYCDPAAPPTCGSAGSCANIWNMPNTEVSRHQHYQWRAPVVKMNDGIYPNEYYNATSMPSSRQRFSTQDTAPIDEFDNELRFAFERGFCAWSRWGGFNSEWTQLGSMQGTLFSVLCAGDGDYPDQRLTPPTPLIGPDGESTMCYRTTHYGARYAWPPTSSQNPDDLGRYVLYDPSANRLLKDVLFRGPLDNAVWNATMASADRAYANIPELVAPTYCTRFAECLSSTGWDKVLCRLGLTFLNLTKARIAEFFPALPSSVVDDVFASPDKYCSRAVSLFAVHAARTIGAMKITRVRDNADLGSHPSGSAAYVHLSLVNMEPECWERWRDFVEVRDDSGQFVVFDNCNFNSGHYGNPDLTPNTRCDFPLSNSDALQVGPSSAFKCPLVYDACSWSVVNCASGCILPDFTQGCTSGYAGPDLDRVLKQRLNNPGFNPSDLKAISGALLGTPDLDCNALSPSSNPSKGGSNVVEQMWGWTSTVFPKTPPSSPDDTSYWYHKSMAKFHKQFAAHLWMWIVCGDALTSAVQWNFNRHAKCKWWARHNNFGTFDIRSNTMLKARPILEKSLLRQRELGRTDGAVREHAFFPGCSCNTGRAGRWCGIDTCSRDNCRSGVCACASPPTISQVDTADVFHGITNVRPCHPAVDTTPATFLTPPTCICPNGKGPSRLPSNSEGQYNIAYIVSSTTGKATWVNPSAFTWDNDELVDLIWAIVHDKEKVQGVPKDVVQWELTNADVIMLPCSQTMRCLVNSGFSISPSNGLKTSSGSTVEKTTGACTCRGDAYLHPDGSCHLECGATVCSGHGTCIDDSNANNVKICSCDRGWTTASWVANDPNNPSYQLGYKCNLPIIGGSTCGELGEPAIGSASCPLPRTGVANQFVFEPTLGYYKRICMPSQAGVPCTSSTNGACVSDPWGGQYCKCEAGWGGPACSDKLCISASNGLVCNGVGTCEDGICVCPAGFMGEACEVYNSACNEGQAIGEGVL